MSKNYLKISDRPENDPLTELPFEDAKDNIRLFSENDLSESSLSLFGNRFDFDLLSYNLNTTSESQFFEDLHLPSKKSPELEDDLSDYTITGDGFISENWSSTFTIPSNIIEVNNEFVILECLIDYQNKILETRRFKRTLLDGKCRLFPNHIIILKISERPGKIQFEFEDGANFGYEKYFNPSEYLPDASSINTGKLIR